MAIVLRGVRGCEKHEWCWRSDCADCKEVKYEPRETEVVLAGDSTGDIDFGGMNGVCVK